MYEKDTSMEGVDTQWPDTLHNIAVPTEENCNMDFVEDQGIRSKNIYIHKEFFILLIIISRMNGLHTYLWSLAQTPINGTLMSLYTCTGLAASHFAHKSI